MKERNPSLPDIAVNASSINSNSDLVLAQSEQDEKSNIVRNQLPRRHKNGVTHQEFIHGVLKKKMKDSWLNTTYQRAIWNARRRLLRGEIIEDFPVEEKEIASGFLAPKMKPDYSKWKRQKNIIPYNATIPKIKGGDNLRNMSGKQGFQLEQTLRSVNGEIFSSDFGDSAIEIYPVEFISLSDRLTLHEPPWLRMLRDGREVETFDNFGLCFGCFQRRGPHYHYRAPIRTGGGYTIYRKNPTSGILPDDDGSVWINNERQSVESLIGTEYGAIWLSDDFTLELFHTFLDNGGDANALKEYLDSNFDKNVLNDLKLDGVNVKQIEDYTEILRRYIREKLEKNTTEQKKNLQEKDEDLQYLKSFVKIAGAGGDLEMLLTLLEEGPQSTKFQSYEAKGGNSEILKHYKAALLSRFVQVEERQLESNEHELTPDEVSRKVKLIDKLRRYVENENEHKRATLLLEFMEKGGRLDALVRYVEKGVAGDGLSTEQELLVREYSKIFSDKTMLLQDIEKFANEHFRNYSSASLLQKYLESGGKVSYLKQYVRDGCFLSSPQLQSFLGNGGDLSILQEVGEEFFNQSSMRKDLNQFPNDPKIIDAYIRKGGNYFQLINAIADAMGDPALKKYIGKQSSIAMNDDLTFIDPKARKFSDASSPRNKRLVSSSYPPPNSPQRNQDAGRNIRSRSSDDMIRHTETSDHFARHLLSHVIETAIAELKYDKFLATEEIRKKNEGAFLSKTVEFNQIRLLEEVRRRRGYPFSDRQQREHASVSPITGKKRERLWKAPKPFMLRRSDFKPTRASSPFSDNRYYDLPSLSEDHILNVERHQRHELDVLRRNYKSRDFRDKWKVEIRSPEGSVISEHDSTTSHEFTNAGPVTLNKPDKTENTSKVSRRDRQRLKMKASKRRPNRDSSRRSKSLLTLPPPANIKPIATMVSREGSFLTKDPEPTEVKSESEYKDRHSGDTVPPDNLQGATEDSKAQDKAGSIDETEDKEERFQEENMESWSSSDDDENMKRIEDARQRELAVPPLPVLQNEDDDAPCQTAFGKPSPQSPRKRIPLFPEMITDPPTQISEERKRGKPRPNLSHRIERKTVKSRRPMRSFGASTENDSEEEEDTSENTVEDVLKKYCIIREERLPRYRHIFDKHIMLMQMRTQEQAMKAQRATNNFAGGDPQDGFHGPAFEELKKCEFLWSTVTETIEEVEFELKSARGGLTKSRALTAREIVFKNPELLRKARKTIKKSRSRQKHLNEDAETEMSSLQTKTSYDYNQSAREGFENPFDQNSTERTESASKAIRLKSPKKPDIPLQDLDDSEIRKILDSSSKKKVELDPVVQLNASTVISLEEKLKRLHSRRDKLRVRLETQKTLAHAERKAHEAEREKRQNFVRQQSEMFQALHPQEDPVLDMDDVPEALRDVNGEISRADSDIILEALDFLRPENGVNFRVFCVLAALSESAKSIQPLVRQLRRTKDARALTIKMDKCKEIYDSLLGSNIDSLHSELRSNGFTAAQQYQMVKKLTRDDGGLSFLDFVTYVPLFLDIHQQIMANPLTVH